jgi:hypothetical protein
VAKIVKESSLLEQFDIIINIIKDIPSGTQNKAVLQWHTDRFRKILAKRVLAIPTTKEICKILEAEIDDGKVYFDKETDEFKFRDGRLITEIFMGCYIIHNYLQASTVSLIAKFYLYLAKAYNNC